MAISFIRSTLDWFAKLGLTVRDDAPKTIDLVNREWGEPAGGLGLSIRELPKEDPAQLPGISVVLRNVSQEPKHLDIPAWPVFYSFQVSKADGTPAPLTSFGRELLKPERHERGARHDLAPGQPVETEIPIGSIFDMRARGEYRVRVSASNGPASNEIIVRVR